MSLFCQEKPPRWAGVCDGSFEGGEACVGSISLAEGFGDLVPIHHFPPRREVVGTAILVFEVVGMLPDIAAQNWGFAAAHSWHQGVVLIGG